MRILLLSLSLLIVPWFHAAAQVTVEVVLDEPEFLRDESMFVKIRVVNRSGQTLKFGQAADWLTFNVQSTEGHTVEKTGSAPVTGEFSLESAQSATKTVNLMPYFGFSEPGRYTISASVKIAQWNDDFTSSPKSFHIIRGARVWDQEFGVPRKDGPPEMRVYSLVRATGMKQTRLYARVTNPEETRVFRVAPLGQVVTFGSPEALVDRASQLHVLLQNGPRSFSYAVFNPEGEWVVRQTFDYTESRPALRVNDAGRVLVAGGVRRFMVTDLPAITAASATDVTNSAPVASPPSAPPVPAASKDGKPPNP
jgi:hypothetical protein